MESDFFLEKRFLLRKKITKRMNQSCGWEQREKKKDCLFFFLFF